jgi:dipeptidyl aminopeptidase/acylaminoacyl peptidase
MTQTAQSAAPLTWQRPPSAIDDILAAPALPRVSISPNQQWLLELDSTSLLPIDELAAPEVAVAGFRLNPQTNGPARSNPYGGMRVRALSGGEWRAVELPTHGKIGDAKIGYVSWSPEGDRVAFTLLQATGRELWCLDIATGTVTQITGPILNAVYDGPFSWLDEERFLCNVVPADRGAPPLASKVPIGPLVQENIGQKVPARTYTKLLKNSHDEALFEYYARSTLEIINLSGDRTPIVQNALIRQAAHSPDGQLILLTTTQAPYSYQFPAGHFPKRVEVIDLTGKLIYTVAEMPLLDYLSIKFDSVRRGRREIQWRSDQPATLVWVEAGDDGDPTQACEERDRLYELPAPFNTSPRHLWSGQYRYERVTWGRDDVALVTERWHDTRQTRLWCIDPSNPANKQLLFERSDEDKYHSPGNPLTKPGKYHRSVLRFTPDGHHIYLAGRGASPTGVYPFLDRFNWQTGATDRVWQCQDPYLESIVDLLDDNAEKFITSRQSQSSPANCLLYHNSQAQPLTEYRDPAPGFADIQEEVVEYDRADGVKLSAKLYLPAGYNPEQDGTLPIVFWVYPEEFKDAKFAGQNNRSRHGFVRPGGASPLFLLTQGYGVLSNPSIPIIGEGDTEPNDTYVEQLLSGAKAAIDYLADRGIADRSRVGIGGHSYGAFTTVNLLAHSDLFCMGIARSGAYNRTLTPFGFQGEQREFWSAMSTYVQMSPFTHADKVKQPLLLIHGQDDSNPGTYPVQTERLFDALKGLGATVRSVILPLEDHGYRSHEGVGHALWEMVEWCDRHLR